MEAEWFVLLNGNQAGPYSVAQLKRMEEITPDTLAWRKGMIKWLPIREIPELKELFKDEGIFPSPTVPESAAGVEDLTLNFPQADPPIFFWLLFLLVLLAYALFQIFT